MKRKKNNEVSENAAVGILRRIFKVEGKDELTLDEVYEATGRSDKDPTTNRNWLNGVLAKLKNYSLITTVSKFENSRNKIDKLKLTIAGKTALGWQVNSTDAQVASINQSIKQSYSSYSDVARAVAEFKNSNPDFDVVFEIKLKEGKVEQNI